MRTFMPNLSTLSLCLGLLFWGAPAAAAEPGAATISAQAAAEGLFDEGLRAAEAGDLATACAKFEASESVDPAAGTLLHLADCYEQSGKLASAWGRFREAQSLADAQGMRDRAEIARARAASLEPRISRVAVRVSTPTPADFQLRIGGAVVPAGSWGSALPFDAGVVTITATAAGYQSFSRNITVPSGAASTVRVDVPALRPLAAPRARKNDVRPSPVAADRGGTQRGIGIATAIVGAVGLAAGGTFAVLAYRDNDRSLDHCQAPTICSARGVELRDQAKTWADASTLSAIAGGALVITGAALYWSAPDGDTDREALSVGAGVSPGGVLLSARGTY